MLSQEHIVEKSKALVWAQMKEYGAGELKILDTYLSRINARDPDSSMVTFTKKEYAELMGIDPDVRSEQLKKYTGGLLRNVVTMDLPGEGYVQYPLFSEAKCYYDEKANQTIIKIDCNSKLRQAFFDLASNGYVTYQLKNVIRLRSQFSIRLYILLKSMPFGWTVGVDELRERLAATAPTYNEFKEFNKSVLKKAVNEINKETDIDVTYECVRRGRSIANIKFVARGREELPLLEADLDPEGEVRSDYDEQQDLFASVLPPEFTANQVKLLGELAIERVGLFSGDVWDVRMRAVDYLRSKTRLLEAQSERVDSPFAWMRGAVAGDWT